jgi:cell division protein FtsN
MEPKSELLVFSKKEITVIITLLVLVALFSFTLGLRVGRTLGAAQTAAAPTTDNVAPLATAPAKTVDAAPADEKALKPGEVKAEPGEVEAAASAAHEQAARSAEDQADAELAKEISREKVRIDKPVPMNLPSQKKGDISDDMRYMLQFGSHRTIAEAAEQVAALKRNKLEAFYLEAKVPGKGTWYRVGVGAYVSKEAAERAGAKMKAANKGLPSFLVQKIAE